LYRNPLNVFLPGLLPEPLYEHLLNVSLPSLLPEPCQEHQANLGSLLPSTTTPLKRLRWILRIGLRIALLMRRRWRKKS
jgi:hypothetical protein